MYSQSRTPSVREILASSEKVPAEFLGSPQGRVTRRSLSGEPGPRPDTLPFVAPATRARCTWAGVALGRVARYSAATPAACGAAIDVPDQVARPVSLVCAVETMDTPGANRSRAEPW